MEIIFLGTNGWFDTKTGNTICTLIKTGSCNIILDAGMGIVKADKYLDKNKPAFLFLSHLHLDHIVGLHALAKFRFPKGLTMVIPHNYKGILGGFMDQPFTVPIKRLPFKLNIKPIKNNLDLGSVKVKAAELLHSSVCFGYRFDIGRKSISYCTDTGVCDQVIALSRNADLLITECALQYGQDDEGWPHLDPEHAAFMAKKSEVKQLVMTHFDANNYKTIPQRKRAQVYARRVFSKSTAAFDGLKIVI